MCFFYFANFLFFFSVLRFRGFKDETVLGSEVNSLQLEKKNSNMTSMPPELASQINKIIGDKVNANFMERDQLLMDLIQGVDQLNLLAEGKITNSAAYPRNLIKDSQSQSTSTSNEEADRRKLEELLDTPHAVHAIRGGWWSVDLRRKKGELKVFRERGVARGADCIGVGKSIKTSRRGHAVKYNRKFSRDMPASATGEQGKYACDIRMSLDTFCCIFHSSCPEFNLIDAFQRGRVKATLFGEGDMTGNDIVQNLENYFLSKIRGGEVDALIDTRIKNHTDGNDVRKAISDIFFNVIGTNLERIGFWTVVTERIRCKVMFEIKDFTELRSRRNLKVNNISEIVRIRRFRRSGKGVLGVSIEDIMNPKTPPSNLVKREADLEVITKYNNSIKGRRRRRAAEEQTLKLRKQEVEEVCWVVLTGFDPERTKDVMQGLHEKAGMSMDDAEWAIKFGVPYYLLKQENPDLSLQNGRRLVAALELAGCEVVLERQYDMV